MLDSFATVRSCGATVQVYHRTDWMRVKLMAGQDDLPYAVETTVCLSESEISVMNLKSYL